MEWNREDGSVAIIETEVFWALVKQRRKHTILMYACYLTLDYLFLDCLQKFVCLASVYVVGELIFRKLWRDRLEQMP